MLCFCRALAAEGIDTIQVHVWCGRHQDPDRNHHSSPAPIPTPDGNPALTLTYPWCSAEALLGHATCLRPCGLHRLAGPWLRSLRS